MTFKLVERGAERWIAAEGPITLGTAAQFEAFLADLPATTSHIVLHSPGGILQEGLALGRLIRASGFSTHIAAAEGPSLAAGHCASACAYAFLGGVARHVDTTPLGVEGSDIGFHHIRLSAGQRPVIEADLQAAIAHTMSDIRAFVAEMGADPRLPDLAATVTGDALFVPQGYVLQHLGITTALQAPNLRPNAPDQAISDLTQALAHPVF